ncbi:hypothetical protein THO17_32420 [Marinomonas sp. THO17]
MAPKPNADTSIKILNAKLRPNTAMTAGTAPYCIPLCMAVKLFGPGPSDNSIIKGAIVNHKLKVNSAYSRIRN